MQEKRKYSMKLKYKKKKRKKNLIIFYLYSLYNSCVIFFINF